jgi:hypothetical protein
VRSFLGRAVGSAISAAATMGTDLPPKPGMADAAVRAEGRTTANRPALSRWTVPDGHAPLIDFTSGALDHRTVAAAEWYE